MRWKWAVAALMTPIAMPATAALAPGVKAPDFIASAAVAGRGFKLNLQQVRRKGPVVLYFFPAAFTPGCNSEAAAFAEAMPQFKVAGATVIGMSADPIEKLKKFSTEHCAGKFPVASATPELINAYDVALGRTVQGRQLSNRTSYVIDPDGKIIHVHSDPAFAGHIRNSLQAVQRWHSAQNK